MPVKQKEILDYAQDFMQVRQQEMLDCAREAVLGAGRGLYGLGETAYHILRHPDDVLYAIGQFAFDAYVIVAAHQPANFPETDGMREVRMLINAIRKEPSLYKDAVTRMNKRVDVLAGVGPTFTNASGPQKVGLISEITTQVLAPGWILKGLRAVNAGRGPLSSSFVPTYKLPRVGERLVEPPPFPIRTAEEILAHDGRYPYVVDARGNLIITDATVRFTDANNNIIAMFVNHSDLAAGNRVVAAGNMVVEGGAIRSVDNSVLWRYFQPSEKHFERIVRRALENHGIWKGGINFSVPEGVGGHVAARIEGAAPQHLASLRGHDFRVLPFLAAEEITVMEGAIQGMAEGGIAVGGVAHGTKEVLIHAAETGVETVRVSQHEKERAHAERVGVVRPELKSSGVVADTAARHVHTVAHNVMNSHACFALRNPFFQSTTSYFLNPSRPPQLLYPSQQQTPCSFDIERLIWSFLSPGTTISNLQDIASRYFGVQISSLTVRSVVDRSPGVTRIGDFVCSNMSYSLSAFAHLLATVGLSSCYNSDQDGGFNALLRSFGINGGVANKTGIIEGDIGDFSRLKILMPGSAMPFSPEELRRICKELDEGINKHNSYPWFSLHFDTVPGRRALYPVLHPCYQKTLTGMVIAILDAHLKGFLNGALYIDEGFLQEWHRTGNTDPALLRAHIQDLKKLVPGYRSLHEILAEEGFNDVDLCNKMRVSYRIIAKQGPMSQEGGTFLIHPEFTVEHTLDLSPAYRAEIESYRQQHGRYPDDYLKLLAIHSRFADSLIQEMQKVPDVAKYLRMLGVINFLCYYIRTLKAVHKKPVVTDVAPYPHFPKALPPLPMRYYQTHRLSFTPAMILKEIPKDVMDRFLYEYFWNGESQESAAVKQWIERALSTIVSRQIGSSDLDRVKIAKMSEKYFRLFAQSDMIGGEALLTPLMTSLNQIIDEAYASIGEEVPSRIKCSLSVFQEKENGRTKWEYFQWAKNGAILELNKKREELRLKGRPLKFQNAEQLFSGWEKNCVKVEAALHKRCDLFHPDFLQAPIQETWLQSRLDFEPSPQQTRIVGGCQIDLRPITPTPLKSAGRLERMTQSLSTTGFTPVTWEGEQYHGFVLETERVFPETGDPRQNYQDADLITHQGYTPLMIDAMRGDPVSLSRSLATGNPEEHLVSGIDALRMLIFSGRSQGALLLLDSGKISDLNHTTEGDVTALHLALHSGLPKVALKLIEKGALFNLPRYKDGYTAVHVAVERGQREAITALCARGANLNQPLPNGKAALHLAAEAGLDPSFAAFLIEKGALPELPDRAGNTALQCAILEGDAQMALYLAEKTPVNLKNEAGETASMTAARYGMFEVMECLLRCGEDYSSLDKTFRCSKDKQGRSVPYYNMRHGQVTFLRHYQTKMDLSDIVLTPLEENAAAHGHGLMVHFFVQGKNLSASQKRHLLEKMIKVDDVHFVRQQTLEQNSSEHCRLAAEYGSSASAELLITNIRSGRDAQPILIAAIKGGNPALFTNYLEHLEGKKFIEKNAPLDPEGNRAVHYAVKYGRVEILKALYRFGAAIDVANSKGETPWQLAKQLKDKEMLELFKKYGVEPQPELEAQQEVARTLEGKDARDDLLTSGVPDAHRRETEALIRATLDSNFPEFRRIVRGKEHHYFEGQPLLFFLLLLDAKTQGDFTMRAMRYLAEQGYSPTMKSRAKEPAILALLNCDTADEITAKLEWLRTCFPQDYQAILSQTNEQGQDLCDRASLQGRPFVLKAMSQEKHSKKAFHYACMGGEIETVRALIQGAAGPSAGELLDEGGNTPLHIAANQGHADIIEELLAWGVNPRLKNRLGNTALHVAIMTKNVEASHRVLDYMGDYMTFGDLANRQGRTPLMLAVMNDLCPLITRLAPHSNLHAVDKQGSNALHLAATMGSLRAIRQLLRLGVDIHVGDSSGSKKSEQGMTALHYAAQYGQIEAFRLLLDQGAEVSRVSSQGKSVAVSMVTSNSEVMYHEMIRLGLLTQPDLHQRLVHAAARSGNRQVLEYLYLMGVRLDEYDEDGSAPLHTAVANNHHAVVDFLLNAGCQVMQPAADGAKTTAFAFAKNSSMRKLLVSYVGKQEIPDFPPPLPFVATEERTGRTSQGSNPPPASMNKEGLTLPERAVIERLQGQYSADFYAMASRVKKEFGLETFLLLFVKKLQATCTTVEAMQIMQKLLTLADSNKQSPAQGPLSKLLKDVWTLPLEQMHQQLQGPWEAVMKEKNAGRSPEQMKDIFTKAKNPLPAEALSRVTANYASVLRHRDTMVGKSQSQLLAAASSQDPMEAVAAIRETVFRKFGYYPYDTQLFAMLALIERPKGRLGQMQTGEGKSLVFAMMAAFYATRGKTVGVITTTQSLAKRDQKKFAEFYQALGISSSHIAVQNPDESHFSGRIIYGTNTDFEFALLRDKIKGPPQVCLIDEVDSLFLDQGLNAARIAAPAPEDHSWMYAPYLNWIRTHKQFDLKAVREVLGRVDGQATPSLTDETLEALFHKGKEALEMREKTHYTVRRGKIVIMDDENTGARQEGCRWPGGMHEFLEAKHNLHVERNSVTLSSISHVAFFKMCEILVGLTGTLGGQEERSELEELYGTELFDIPPRFPSERVYLAWRLCDDRQSYYEAVQNRVREMQAAGRPTLILLQTVEDCEEMAKALSHAGILFQLFTAVQQEKEEVLVKRAVAPGTVTVATSAAGRGTDFMLSPESIRAGGMHAILGGLPINQRVENQNTGRTRRQGQPGSYEVLIPPDTSFVNELLLLGLLKGSPPPESMKDKRIWLLRLRALRVKMLSEKRKAQSQSSLVHYSLFQDFTSMQKIVEGRLSGLQKAECKEKLTHLFAEFSLETEHQSLSAGRFREKYERFLETRVFPLPWFEGLHLPGQQGVLVEDSKR